MTDSSASTSEHVYRGWKIRITDTAVDTKSSARVEVWKPEHDPRSHSGIVVPFLKPAASPAEAHVAALAAPKDRIDAEMVSLAPPSESPGEEDHMTRCWPCAVV